jgi:hypothetical protein
MSQNSPRRSVIASFERRKPVVEFSATNAPNPPRLTKNLCLLRFRSFGFRRYVAKFAREGRYSDFWNKKNLQLNFPHRTHPIHPVWPKTHVCCIFGVLVFDGKTVRNSSRRSVIATFGTKKLVVEFSATNASNPLRLTQNSCCVFEVLVFDGTTSQNSPVRDTIATFRTKKLVVEFSGTNASNPPRLTQNSCLLRFWSFGFRWYNVAKLAREGHYSDFLNKKLVVEISATNASNPPRLT